MEAISQDSQAVNSNHADDVGSNVVGAQAATIRKSLSGKIIIRTPEPNDREAVRELTLAAHAQTVFGDIPFLTKSSISWRIVYLQGRAMLLVCLLNLMAKS